MVLFVPNILLDAIAKGFARFHEAFMKKSRRLHRSV